MRAHTRWLVATVFVAVALPLMGGVAHAEGDEDPSDLERNVTDVDPSKLDRNITDLDLSGLDENVEPLESTTSEDGSTEITLSTDILFEFGDSEIDDASAATIPDMVEDIPDGEEVTVDGHTDSIPYERGNDVLSKERAQAVADVIADARPDLDLAVEGHGESDPVADNETGGEDNPDGRAQNRRVEIRYDG